VVLVEILDLMVFLQQSLAQAVVVEVPQVREPVIPLKE
jgi:hypothetical protein